MAVVSDTSSLNYLILIRQAELLLDLFGRVIIPKAVFQELQDEKTPDEVREWIASHPAWLEVQAVRTPLDAEFLQLHKGEAEAIALAQELNATVLIIDEKEGREIAVRRGIPITGLLGVLRDAAARNLVDFPSALADLQQTTFRVSPKLINELLKKHNEEKS
jgi:predicted nucleic acid-binding protein